jgi:hypothetical protein
MKKPASKLTSLFSSKARHSLIPTATVSDSAETAVSPVPALSAITGAILINVAVGSLYAWSAFVAPLEVAMGLGRFVRRA